MNFFDDLDQLNKGTENNEFSDLNNKIYDEHNYILSPYKNPEFFDGLRNMVRNIPYTENGFTQKDLDEITIIYSNNGRSYFQYVTSLNELKYFNNLKIIDYYDFDNCRDLKSIIFPENLKYIRKYAFNWCTSLKEIIFPENIKEIDNYAFNWCTSLEKIVIPKRFKNEKYYTIESIFSYVDISKVNITYI